MKKLIITLAVVVIAVGVHGAQITWGATATSTYDGQNLYLLTAMADSYATLDAFNDTVIDYGTVSKAGMAYKVAQTTTDNSAITKSANFYLAVVDGKTIHYLDVTTDFRKAVFDPPESGSPISKAFADVANSTTTATIGGDPGPAPEPTSGLLLIFGVAGLALRRRRA